MCELTKKEQLQIRLKVSKLLDATFPDYKEIERLGKLLGTAEEDKKERVIVKEQLGMDPVEYETPRRVYKIVPKEYLSLRKKGYTRKEIAEYFDMEIYDMELEIRSLQYHGLMPKLLTTSSKNLYNRLTVEKYLKFKKQNLSDTEIACILRIDCATLSRHKKRLGIELDARGQSNRLLHVTKEKYLSLSKKEKSITVISKKLGISRATMYRLRKGWGLI